MLQQRRLAHLSLLLAVAACGEGPSPQQEPATGSSSTGIGGDDKGVGGSDGGGEGGSGGSGGPGVPPPQQEAFFNEPLGGELDLELEKKLIELLDMTVAGSKVRVSLFHWTRTNMTEPFIAAHERGVDVRFVLDRDNVDANGDHNAAISALRAALPADRVVLCRDGQTTGACIGGKINHNKFFLFSELADGSRHVVVQSSANLTKAQLRAWNNMVVIRDDAKLYDAYLKYWDDLRAQKLNPNYYWSAKGDTKTKGYFFPRQSGDTIEAVLGNVECAGGTKVRVGMAIWTKGRLNLAHALVGLRKKGCVVEAVIGPSVDADIVKTLKAGGAKVYWFETATGESIHSKYLLVDGRYNGGAGARIVWTGSHNYTTSALRNNDETLLKLEDPAIHAAFTANWSKMQKLSKLQ